MSMSMGVGIEGLDGEDGDGEMVKGGRGCWYHGLLGRVDDVRSKTMVLDITRNFVESTTANLEEGFSGNRPFPSRSCLSLNKETGRLRNVNGKLKSI